MELPVTCGFFCPGSNRSIIFLIIATFVLTITTCTTSSTNAFTDTIQKIVFTQ